MKEASAGKPIETAPGSEEFVLGPASNERLASLCGPLDEHLRRIEARLGVEINHRGGHFQVIGAPPAVRAAGGVLRRLYEWIGERGGSRDLSPSRVHLFLQEAGLEEAAAGSAGSSEGEEVAVRTRRGVVRGQGPNQRRYLLNIQRHDLSFGIGPAGTGKTYLAVASAVDALERDQVRRLLLVRPAVEAGERLGFLPGDLVEKIDPYLRPLYDALYEMLGFERVGRLMERNVIEVAPLAFMRGRTLNESFIILDEAQNTTVEQMKMFLTRIGFGSTAVVTGDVTQVDLPRGQLSGLRQAIQVLKDVEGVSFSFFQAKDVVRHELVKRIVDAYEDFDARHGGDSA
jgi:phosphate starvation-inducible PhoH-like protein